MNTKPYQFQLEDAKALALKFNGRGLCASEMGTGKSLTSLLTCQMLKASPVVIVCPASLKYSWERECKIHFGLRAVILEGTTPPIDGGFPVNAGLVVINYDILGPWLKWLRKLKPQAVILDESHFVSGPRTQRSKNCRKLCRKVPHVILLSGTPLVNRPSELWHQMHLLHPKVFTSFWSWARRFCLPPDAPVIMGDLSEKPISEVQVGDKVVGWARPGGRRRRLVKATVLDVLRKQAPLQKVFLQNGKVLVCTPDHMWATGRCGTPGHKYDHEYTAAKTGRTQGKGGRRGFASRIMEVFRGTRPKFNGEDYILGYVHGFFRGDGWCTKRRLIITKSFQGTKKWQASKYTMGCGCKDKVAIKRVAKYLRCFEIPHKLNPKRGDGVYCLILTKKRKLSYLFLTQTSAPRNSKAWWAGFLGGIYDAEGSGLSIAQYKSANPVTYRMIIQALNVFKFDFRKREDGVCVRGGRKAMLRFWNIANPAIRRKLVKHVFSAGGAFNAGGVSSSSHPDKCPYVMKIESLPGIHKTYTLTTTTGNYIAYGHGSKNCSPRRTHWGWDCRGASNLPRLRRLLKKFGVIRRRKEDVLRDLPPKIRSVVPVPLTNPKEYEKAEKDFLGWLAETKPEKLHRAMMAEQLVKWSYLKQLAAELSMDAKLDWINTFLKGTDEKLIVFAVHRKVVNQVLEKFENIAVKVDGSVTGRKRQQAMDRFVKHPKCRLFVGNRAAEVGWSAKGVSAVVHVELPWAPGSVVQREDRAHGIGRGNKNKKLKIYYLVAFGTIEMRLAQLLVKKHKIIGQTLDGKNSKDFDLFNELEKFLWRREMENDSGS